MPKMEGEAIFDLFILAIRVSENNTLQILKYY